MYFDFQLNCAGKHNEIEINVAIQKSIKFDEFFDCFAGCLCDDVFGRGILASSVVFFDKILIKDQIYW